MVELHLPLSANEAQSTGLRHPIWNKRGLCRTSVAKTLLELSEFFFKNFVALILSRSICETYAIVLKLKSQVQKTKRLRKSLFRN